MSLKQKAPGTGCNQPEGTSENKLRRQSIKLSPRLKRLAGALLDAPNGLSREDCDRVTPCCNAPEYVRQLRERFAIAIPCDMRPFTSIDGLKGKYGIYRLTEADKQKLATALDY